ncbi:TetR/AcrR family transcriptional regulator [Streptomyces sp. LP05-1]|uniref:TetR/AcrR family transcriptional regulator n=1 Tax=Streptomyces pyxinae TaxID=2970734 RepID=A0ABT2CRU5_9ACTN|nr:TetR/AcrR family transcriptional regulator [Streptomyces sp. LP05-1]MCS0639812.1 TetR/AcrR family transcriptional regulator [Streptomyces sp. LP05-1]
MKKTPRNDTERPAPAVPTRDRIVRAASRLMQRQGYDGTGIKQISEEAEATLGSVYHFFPGGKQEIAVAAIRLGDEEFAADLRAALDAHADPGVAVAEFTRHLAEGLRASDWVDGCPITTPALGTAGRLPDIQEAAATAFARWRELVRVKLVGSGIAETEAAELAHTVISMLEGAELAAQVGRSDQPLDIAGRHLAELIGGYRPAAG